jgi:hypothetical protein
MINTYRYEGHKNLREDNTTQKLEVRPSKILEIKGPLSLAPATYFKSKAMEIFAVPKTSPTSLNWRYKAHLCKQQKSQICIPTGCWRQTGGWLRFPVA